MSYQPIENYGIKDLEKVKNRWGDAINELVTTRIPFTGFSKALSFRSADDIKTVIAWE